MPWWLREGHHLLLPAAEWHWLHLRAAEDSRTLALYGFGRGMAEALQLGVDVIATDFGVNTDFCSGPLAHPVRWRPAPIPRGAYPFGDGHSWAEPDLEHAAELCRAVAAQRLALAADPRAAADPSRDLAVLASYRERFSFAVVGGRYRARLRWRGDRSPLGWRWRPSDSTDISRLILVHY